MRLAGHLIFLKNGRRQSNQNSKLPEAIGAYDEEHAKRKIA
jgi:hypothetical protein